MIKSIQEKVAFYSRHNFLFYNEMRKIRRAEQLDPVELRRRTEDAVMRYVRYAAAHSPFYAERFKGIDLNGPFSEVYPALPVLTKAEVRENGVRLLTTSERFLKKAYTSGTSGTPLTVYRSPKSILKENAYLLYFKIGHGMRIGDRMVSLRGMLNNTKLYYFNKAENMLYLSSFLFSRANTAKYAALLEEYKPQVMHAFPSSALMLLDLLEEGGYKFQIPRIYTSSETLYAFQREKIEKGFSGKIFDWFGNVERTIAMAQCTSGNYHEMPMYGLNEFGPTGVVSTSIINRAFPLIKYFADDICNVEEGTCSCGRTRYINSIDGRIDDVVILGDGTRVMRLDIAFKGVPNIKFAQIVQSEPASMNVNVVPAPAFNDADKELLMQKLATLVNNSINIIFNIIEEKDIIKTKSNKYQLVVSKIA